MKKPLEQLKKLLIKLQEDTGSQIDHLIIESNKLIDSCNEVDNSWSGSFAGYHGQLYFQDFQKPKLEERFNVEWGGINGIPKGWKKKEAKEIKNRIEDNISKDFSIDKLEEEETATKEKAENTLHEIKIVLSSIEINDMEQEGGLRSEIEKFKFGKGKKYFIKSMIPTTIASRDQEALIQGICIPGHIYYLGVGRGIIDTCNSIKNFLRLLDRLIRQLEIKKKQPFKISQNTWNWINPFWLLSQILIVMLKLVKLAWKHKIISGAILILTLLGIDYSIAGKNLQYILESIRGL